MGEVRTGTVKSKKIDSDYVVSTSELACVLGLSIRRVQALIQDGVISTEDRGVIKLADAVQKYVAFVKRDWDEEEEEAEKLKVKSEAKLKQAKAAMAAMDAKERMGQMHRSEDVAAMTEDLIYAIRSSLIALPGRLAVDVLDARDKAEASDIIRDEVYKVMEELSCYEYDPEKYMNRVRERLSLEALNEQNDE